MAPRPLSADASTPFSNRSDRDFKQTIMTSVFAQKSPKDTILSSGYHSSPEAEAKRNRRIGTSGQNDHSDPFASSSNTSLPAFSNKMRPLHKPEIGGPKSPFLPIVRVPSDSVVGVISRKVDSISHSSTQQNLLRTTSTFSTLSESKSKFSKVLDGWQVRDEKNTSRGPQSETLEYRFRPIISDDEKIQLLRQPQPIAGTDKMARKKISKIPIVEIIFREDDSLGSISSMEYDGSEHDLDAVFQDAHLYPIHFDTRESLEIDNFIEAYNRDYNVDGEIRRNYKVGDASLYNIEMGDNEVLKTRDNGQNHNKRRNQKIVEAIEKDPDLSVANSTILKGISDKDPDLSMDGDENFDFFQNSSDRAEVATRESNKIQSQENDFDDIQVEKKDNPSPPLSEISIPLTHDYGYGFYLKPLWTLDHTPSVAETERFRKVRQLINEGRSRRSRSKLTKLVTNAMAE